MQAQFEMHVGLERLKAILGSMPPSSADWNEAQNRFKFIDRLLSECLGWEKPDINVEENDAFGDRADYVMGQPAKAILEAKRESKTWGSLPSGSPKKVRKLEPLLIASSAFKECVHQVIPYCSLRGAPIAIVCNGPQLAIFQAITIGHEPLKGDCFLFDGFDDYVNNFALLWTLLSPEGITENRALHDLVHHRNPRIPSKASLSILEPNRHRYRDNLQNELREIGSLILEEIEDNPDLRPEFYRECYVPIEANNRHLLLSKQIISNRYSRVSGDGSTPSALDGASKEGKLSDSYLRNAGSKPVVVIGDVGVGKTSFFENLFLQLDDRSDSFIININLGIRANLASGLKDYIIEAIPETLNSAYDLDIEAADFVHSVYHEEIKRFDNSIDGQEKHTDKSAYEKAKIKFLQKKLARRDAHLHASLAHIAKGQKKRVVLVIDNADQRNFEDQQEAFLIAQELAATRSLFVFIALRPSTFYMSKTTGTLAAYQNKILTISPPPADEVIQKRLTFALRVAEGKAAPAALEDIRLNLTSIVAFLKSTLRSIRTNNNIRQFLSNVTGGNTRSVIEMITSFCGSPNVDARKIVDIESSTGNYVVPLHEFTKHALLGEYSYYNPHSSLVACNIFDVVAADPKYHFICPLIIGFLSSNLGVKDNDGFVAGDAVAVEMSKLGFLEEQTSLALKRLAKKKLIETPYSHYREIEVPDFEKPTQFYYRSTSVGLYHIRFWGGSFSFLDAMSTDTPIFEQNARERVSKLAASFDILDRLEKTVTFRDYLESAWHLSNFNTTYFNFPDLLESQENEFALVKSAASKANQRKGLAKFHRWRS